MKSRESFIDDLRGICMIAMILIHTSYFYINEPLVYNLWNMGQFAVPGFVFCSTYLFFKKQPKEGFSIVPYIIKRLKRLLIPYYIFLTFFLTVIWVYNPKVLTISYFLKSIFLTGGVDINWLILLFVYLTIISIILIFLRKRKVLWYGFLTISLASSMLYLKSNGGVDYRYTMWLPWTLVLYFSYYFVTNKNIIQFIITTGIVLSGLFILTRVYLSSFHHSLSFIDNKYPPNLYYLSFGLGIVLLIYIISSTNVFRPLNKVTTFFSKNSYPLYFIHYIVLTISTYYIKSFSIPWYGLFLIVISVSVIIQLASNTFQKHFSHYLTRHDTI